METDLAIRLRDQPMRVETLYNYNGRPRIWGDGSEVKMIVDGAGLIDWSQTAEVNPWLVKHCYVRGHNVDRELKRKFREQQCHDCGVPYARAEYDRTVWCDDCSNRRDRWADAQEIRTMAKAVLSVDLSTVKDVA